jgi:uncharacterized HhH-GPD family protein
MTAPASLPFTGDADADRLLTVEPLALLVGMLLDQQVPMEWAFRGPATLKDRLGGTLDAAAIAAMSPDAVEEVFRAKPAMHRYPGSMAKRIQTLCRYLLETYDGRADALWLDGDPDAREVLRRLKALPGYGDQKAKIFVALLGKQLGVQPSGWREAAGAYGEEGSRLSIADVVDEASLAEVREFKRAQRAAAKQG